MRPKRVRWESLRVILNRVPASRLDGRSLDRLGANPESAGMVLYKWQTAPPKWSEPLGCVVAISALLEGNLPLKSRLAFIKSVSLGLSDW